MSWFLLNRNLTLLEPYDWKLSRTVLRGERGSNASDLPGKAIAKEGMADYIRYLFKTVRKFYGEAVVVTQEVDDIISSPIVKESIVNNSDCKILLDQRKYLNKFSQIQSLLGLTDKEKAQILSVNMSNDPRRKYKEVWFGLGGCAVNSVRHGGITRRIPLLFDRREREGGTGRAHKGTGRQYRTGYPKACGKETESKQ